MRKTFFLWRSLALLLLVCTAFVSAQTSSQWRQNLEKWRTQQAADLTAPEGWLSLVGLEWIKPGDNSFGSAADNSIRLPGSAPAHVGVLHLDDNLVTLGAPANGFPAGLMVNDQTAVGGLVDTGEAHPTRLEVGSLVMIVIHRGNQYYLRIKDALAPTLMNFNGLQWYAPDPRYRVQAKWTPYNPPLKRSIPDILGLMTDEVVPGVAEFTLHGQRLSLEPILEEPGDTQLFFIFRDKTSRKTTYGAGRFLYTKFPDHGLSQPGTITLDFNRAQNPPCAYTPYATCPLPPKQNRLPIAIPAGERRYQE
ncbi:MAG: DUF1684 domain-containing protein [Acidobacteriaceae bacterium]